MEHHLISYIQTFLDTANHILSVLEVNRDKAPQKEKSWYNGAIAMQQARIAELEAILKRTKIEFVGKSA